MHTDPVWQYSAHPALKAVKEKLEARFAERFTQLPSTPEWLTFRVHGFTEEVLIRTLEREQQQFFRNVGSHGFDFEVVCDPTGKNRGVSVRYLPGGGLSGDPGFWYY